MNYWYETMADILAKHSIVVGDAVLQSIAKAVEGAASVQQESSTGTWWPTQTMTTKPSTIKESGHILCPRCCGQGSVGELLPGGSHMVWNTCETCHGSGVI